MLHKEQLPQPFEKKLWLSSPTMHGEELTYVAEAYETNWMSTVGKNIDEVAFMHIVPTYGLRERTGV